MSSDPAVGRPLKSSHGPTHGPVIGIVGAGAAGTLVAIHLLRELRASGTGADVVLIDPAESGRGVAYSTTDARHLLNVPAGRMSALPDDPEHFVGWARCQTDPCLRETTLDDYVPRRSYGAYLRDTLEREIIDSARVRLLRRRERAVSLEPVAPTDLHSHQRIELAYATSVVVDQVVLAQGIFAPGTAWAPLALLASDRFVTDPWAPGALAAIDDDGDVLLVGTGLTMVDVAMTLESEGRVLHAVSRRGRLPKSHSPLRLAAIEPSDQPVDLDILTLRQFVVDHLRAAVRTHGDWRAAMDGLRPHTARSGQCCATTAVTSSCAPTLCSGTPIDIACLVALLRWWAACGPKARSGSVLRRWSPSTTLAASCSSTSPTARHGGSPMWSTAPARSRT